jgi:hypothetical protein
MENTIQRQLRGVRLKVGFNIGHKRQAFVFTDKAVIRRNRTEWRSVLPF